MVGVSLISIFHVFYDLVCNPFYQVIGIIYRSHHNTNLAPIVLIAYSTPRQSLALYMIPSTSALTLVASLAFPKVIASL
ncbi:hypothetical protein GGS24DRAFT_456555 [Hypoxylon argillaceum]|nr:hypothetical protein GGS24DRAFT_456555 [Hypoxylon argillaceum]